ncbi:MAG: DUF2252 family protein [Phyllobacterium sp.]|uniref:DUF2252 family protein n=1 Tax=Phyllobacterium sp. TaxID=1871046 RepID=UPI0030F24D17
MASFMESFGAFEAWLEAELKGDLFQPDRDKKHTKMQDNAFAFLRATYWRWAETILEICPELSDAPVVVAIGDTHLENFGTWRDVEGRLVWGANDFDDAAPMPYALDLVRLAVSAALARNDETTSVREICETILGGYRLGLNKLEPIILDEEHRNLRENLVMPENERQKFWDKLEKAPHELRGTQPAYEFALHDALPEINPTFSFARRSAGTGSLGRPRFAGTVRWKGGNVVREAKRLVQSAWLLAHSSGDHTIFTESIAKGRQRSPDPHYQVTGSIIVRRLSPNSRKIEVEDDREIILSHDMLEFMGREIANCHAHDATAFAAVVGDLEHRGSEWLCDAVKKVRPIVEADYEEFKDNFPLNRQ